MFEMDLSKMTGTGNCKREDVVMLLFLFVHFMMVTMTFYPIICRRRRQVVIKTAGREIDMEIDMEIDSEILKKHLGANYSVENPSSDDAPLVITTKSNKESSL
ncbi:hypothetical protein N7540_003825 [Penicillium herquei]|nr:hypothetical protein N7540_003825 [Penicillium herquei]